MQSSLILWSTSTPTSSLFHAHSLQHSFPAHRMRFPTVNAAAHHVPGNGLFQVMQPSSPLPSTPTRFVLNKYYLDLINRLNLTDELPRPPPLYQVEQYQCKEEEEEDQDAPCNLSQERRMEEIDEPDVGELQAQGNPWQEQDGVKEEYSPYSKQEQTDQKQLLHYLYNLQAQQNMKESLQENISLVLKDPDPALTPNVVPPQSPVISMSASIPVSKTLSLTQVDSAIENDLDTALDRSSDHAPSSPSLLKSKPSGRRGVFLAPQRKSKTLVPTSPMLVDTDQKSDLSDHSDRFHENNLEPNAIEQWRVGKTPGHQGSHLRTPKRKVSEAKTSDDEDIAASAARVLKRPFRPPTRIFLAPARSTPNRSSDRPEQPSSDSSNITVLDSASSVLDNNLPSTPISSSPPRGSRRVSRPFKSPFPRSAAPSPSSSASTRGSSKRCGEYDPELVARLEARVRILRQAVRYKNDPDEDDRLARLVDAWRDAGREVVDQLFVLVPAPELDEKPYGATSGQWGGNGARRGGGYDDWAWDGQKSDLLNEQLTSEQLSYLATTRLNSNHERVDDDDIPLFPPAPREDELDRLIDEACALAKDTEFVPYHRSEERYHDDNDVRTTPLASTVWDRGAMMLRLGVDPELFGWDTDADDWADVE